MIIESSTVAMKSERSYYSHVEKKSAELITTEDAAASLEFSEESKSLVEQMKEYKEEQKRQAKEQQKQAPRKVIDLGVAETEKAGQPAGIPVRTEEDIQIATLKRILEMLNRMREKRRHYGGNFVKLADGVEQQMKELRTNLSASKSLAISGSLKTGVGAGITVSGGNTGSAPTAIRPTTFKKVTVTSEFYTEAEHTAFQAQGMVNTKDGRQISFDVQVEMSRAFCAKYEECIVEDYVMCDPLVFNLEGNIGSVTNQKFLFDLDADGTAEEMSFTSEGSGFLALDKNGDGKINDGSELFGTKSGDGFKDLAIYDEDGNGWIDEADSVFDDLTIWTLNEKGEKVQLSLLEADVGAIYLGKASTEFALKNETTHETNGAIRSTGVYLKESGGTGTVQHIDLAI